MTDLVFSTLQEANSVPQVCERAFSPANREKMRLGKVCKGVVKAGESGAFFGDSSFEQMQSGRLVESGQRQGSVEGTYTEKVWLHC